MVAEKRGLSPVIASVLMILLVLSLSSLVFSWSRGLIEDKGDEIRVSTSADSLCDAVDLRIVVVNKSGDTYGFEAVNRGNVNISLLRFRIYPGGDSNIVDSTIGVLAGGAIAGSVVLSGAIDRVEVLSVLAGDLVGTPSDVVCSKNPTFLEGV